MLEVAGFSAGYQGNDVLHAVAFRVDAGEAVMIIGSNGAGKTTLFRAMCGLLSPSAGQVRFEGNDITRLPAERIARLGLRFVSAERHLFPRMTVQENLLLGAYPHRPDPQTLSTVLELFPRLAERRRQHAGTMSGGEQQMLAVARGIMSEPVVLMIDELSLGLAPVLTLDLFQSLRKLRREGLTILLVEQNVRMALKVSDYAYVLSEGKVELHGPSHEVENNEEVRRAYLGI